MAFLFILNSVAYYLSTFFIVIAIMKMPKRWRWMWIVTLITCSFFATVYLGAAINIIPEDDIGLYTRPVSSVIPVQLAATAWIFAKILRSGGIK